MRTWFRKQALDELAREADELYGAGRFGEAKLAYDRLAGRAHKERAELAAAAEERALECCDRLALARAEDAIRLHASGQSELAQEELRHALETARGEAALSRVRELGRELERKRAVEDAREPAPLSDEEKLTLITSAWEPLQAQELESYGEPLFEALLALERGEPRRAVGQLTALLANAKEPSYLWLELGRALLSSAGGSPPPVAAGGAADSGPDQGGADDAASAGPANGEPDPLTAGERALRTFLTRIGPDEGGAARLLAHRELAHIAHERADRDGAVAELEACAEALSDDPRPYLDLGNYLRAIGRPREAIEVLELGASLFPEGAIEWPVTMELGLACAAAGDPRAVRLLEGVLESLLAQGHRDLPPAAAIALAKLHDQQGNPARAADLYRALSEGSDLANRALYQLEAARLLDVLGLTDEAARMRERARALGEEAVDSEDASA